MLMGFDPFREFDHLLRRTWGNGLVGMPMDAYRHGDEFLIEFDLPGVDRNSIGLTVERNVLQVTAQRAGRYGEGDEVLAAERPQGTLTRQLFLGEGLDTEQINASYDDGVLKVVIPIAEEAKPHKIQISAGPGAKALEAGEVS